MNPLWRIDTRARIVSQNMKKNSYIRESDFHGRNAVAPLKHPVNSHRLAPFVRLPRQKCRSGHKKVKTCNPTLEKERVRIHLCF